MKTNFWSYFTQFFLEWKIFSGKSCSENLDTHFMFNNFFFFRKPYRLWDNVEKYSRAGQATNDNIIWRIRIAYLLTKATNTDSESVILITFVLQ